MDMKLKVEGSRCHGEGLSREANRVRCGVGIATYKLERSGSSGAEPCELRAGNFQADGVDHDTCQ